MKGKKTIYLTVEKKRYFILKSDVKDYKEMIKRYINDDWKSYDNEAMHVPYSAILAGLRFFRKSKDIFVGMHLNFGGLSIAKNKIGAAMLENYECSNTIKITNPLGLGLINAFMKKEKFSKKTSNLLILK